MITKKQFRQLLKKGLTGREAGQLVLRDSWEVDNGRPGFLDFPADIEAITQSLSNREMAVYRRYLEAYRIISFTLQEAAVQALKIQMGLRIALDLAFSLFLINRIQNRHPAIVTQKQYDDLRAKHLAAILAKEEPILRVIAWQADELMTNEQFEEFDDWEDWEDWREWTERAPALWEKARRHVLETLGMETAVSDDALADVKISLKKPYEAGLASWVDAYLVDCINDEVPGRGIAILQHPEPWQVDERDYFVQSSLPAKALEMQMRGIEWEGASFDELVEKSIEDKEQALSQFLAYEVVIGAASEILGVDMTEGLQALMQNIMESVDTINMGSSFAYFDFSFTKNIEPDVDYTRYLVNRITIALGENWHKLKKGKGPRLARLLEVLDEQEQQAQGGSHE